MATRVILGGRTAWGNGEWWRHTRQAQATARRKRADEAFRQELEDNPPPLTVPAVEQPGVPREDRHDGLTYRLVARLDPAEGWVAASTVMAWYGVDYARVVAWVRAGMLDAAMERHSPTRRYRVTDPVRCAAEATKPAPDPTGKRGRGKKK
jgi:hypothetical protein